MSRPVDIDQSQTGFAVLRSMRIYQFRAGSPIDGHAEEDEVFIVVLAGSVQLTMSECETSESSLQSSVSAVGSAKGDPCVAYLPPNGSYRLTPTTDVEVAYMRVTPITSARSPKVFSGVDRSDSSGNVVLFEGRCFGSECFSERPGKRVLSFRRSYPQSAMTKF